MAAEGSVDGIQVDELLERLATVLTPAYFAALLASEVEPYFQEIARANFGQEGTRDAPWESLRASTAERRALYGFPPEHPINVRTGDLQHYLLSNGIIEVENDGAAWTWPPPAPDAEVAKKLRTAQGGDAKSRTPARPIIEATERDLLAVVGLLETRIVEHLVGPL